MKTVCSTNMPYVREAFATLGETAVIEGRSIQAADLRDADLLAIRSTTQVNAALLEGSRVKFVGTATIGIDHMDIPYLERHGIAWSYSPGCNANSVAEYLACALLCLGHRHGFTLEGKTLGVIGIGNVGSHVVEKALALGLRVLPNDPPREEREGAAVTITTAAGTRAAGLNYTPLKQVLAESDMVTVHVPMHASGPHATLHLANAGFFAALKPGAIFVNAARGKVTETDALLDALGSGRVAHAVIDTWEGEPEFRTDLLARVDLATPHIAGHSFEGKVTGTVMVYHAACRHLGVAPAWSPVDLLPPPEVPLVEMDAAGREDEELLWELVRRIYDIERDDRDLRAAEPETRTAHFDRLRKNYPMRREFRFTKVRIAGAVPGLRAKVRDLGFGLE